MANKLGKRTVLVSPPSSCRFVASSFSASNNISQVVAKGVEPNLEIKDFQQKKEKKKNKKIKDVRSIHPPQLNITLTYHQVPFYVTLLGE